MRFLAVIPARGGSKGVPYKNIRLLDGKPLIAYTIEAAIASGVVDRLLVSTDDPEIAKFSRLLGAEVLIRPSALAEDETPTLPVLRHTLAVLAETGYIPDAVMTLQPTSPLRTAKHIAEAAEVFASDPDADSLVSCVAVPHIYHPRSVMKLSVDGYLEAFLGESIMPLRRQDKEPVYARNGAAIYITRRERLGEYIFGGKLVPYHMDQADSIDIDTEADFAEAEKVLRERSCAN